ncbi:MAG: excisionase family DNA-binding protein [Spirochaetia bacterium]|nr:excisionase family DNA-binding protein [Spirochaetia bacterium]
MTTAQAAEVLDVHESSIKRWCNEGLLQFEKTDGRHRRIHLADLLAFSKKQGNEARIARFHPYVVEVYEAVKEAGENGDPSSLIAVGKSFIDQGEFFHLKNLFHHVLEDPRLGKSFLFDRFFAPLMSSVGNQWEDGIVDVAVEHFVSECLSDALNFARYEAFRAPETSSRTALVACSEGNWHSFGSKCAQIILQAAGYCVHYLGVSTPYADLARLMSRLRCRTLVLSFSRPQSLADIHRCLNILSDHHSAQNPIALHIGANFLTADFLASVETSFPVSFHRTLASFETLLSRENPS